jgi:hyperosmotically inducible periplasmic protein
MSNRMRFLPAVTGGVAAGAAVMFFVDPQSGRRRRKATVERTAAVARRTARTATRSTRAAVAESEGLGRRIVHTVAGRPRPVANEEMLADRVRSELFRNDSVPKGQLNVNVERDDTVVLRGQVQRPEEITAIERRVRGIPGVRDFENLLHTPGTPAPMHST